MSNFLLVNFRDGHADICITIHLSGTEISYESLEKEDRNDLTNKKVKLQQLVTKNNLDELQKADPCSYLNPVNHGITGKLGRTGWERPNAFSNEENLCFAGMAK